ncbi:MAG: N-acetylmuramoyl-L-alanine amidase [Alicyclobacillaceae bacterium]|nr:N-acetylmuramoyl-L-alanine amidase [Alicyclobacillaceae bacterium]
MKTGFFVILLPWRKVLASAALAAACLLLLWPAARFSAVPGIPSWWTAPVVAVDPGHGGYDPGVSAPGGTPAEKDITLQIGKRLARALERRGFRAILTRTDDRDYALPGQRGREAKRQDLDARIALAEAHAAAAFVSIHCNSSPAASRGGAETFYNPSSAESVRLAARIQDRLRRIPGMSPREAHDGSQYYLLQRLRMPAVIVEAGYLKIPADRQKLLDPGYQQEVADAVAEGIAEFFREDSGRLNAPDLHQLWALPGGSFRIFSTPSSSPLRALM